ncbi:hypothetical protein [Paenibacillus elgii]|uniref:hypothetical protein n=1 Tax=Paenibacillus elgii TaxID=189691 RepID=UPI0013D8CEA9|nr:hypothetical protein [Paenibacillus elgii]
MSMQIEPAGQPSAPRNVKPRKPMKKTYLILALVWAVLVGSGAWGGKLYTDHLKRQLKEELAVQTNEQLTAVQEQYQKQIAELKDNMTGEMAKLQTKVDAVNELLAFTKDSASSKTDNSNQLYTQLAEVKKKLEDLKKQLDALQ